jgi:DNA repair ATPase RecN
MPKKYLLILLYLLSYCLIVLICTIFQWGYECDFEFSTCLINTEKLNAILQTSATIITPIVVIWGYFTWREQEVYKTSKEIMASILTQTNAIYKAWKNSRNYLDTYSRFDTYCLKDIISISPEILENSELSKKELERIRGVYALLSDLYFSLNHLHIVNKKLNLDNIFDAVDTISNELEKSMNELSTFQSQLFSIKNNYTNLMQPEQKIREICHRLDSSSSPLGRIDIHGKLIDSVITKVTDEIVTLSDKI